MEPTKLVLSVEEPRLEFDAARRAGHVDDRHVPGSKVARIADRHLCANEHPRPKQCAERIRHADVCDVADGFPAGIAPEPDLGASRGGSSRKRIEGYPWSRASLHPAQLAFRDPGDRRDLGERQAGDLSGER